VYSCPENKLSYLPCDAMDSLTWIESMSTDNTRAPSLASSAARGLPTTSDLKKLCKRIHQPFGMSVPIYHCNSLAIGAVSIGENFVINSNGF
jgi:hypothetical protein